MSATTLDVFLNEQLEAAGITRLAKVPENSRMGCLFVISFLNGEHEKLIFPFTNNKYHSAYPLINTEAQSGETTLHLFLFDQ